MLKYHPFAFIYQIRFLPLQSISMPKIKQIFGL